MLKHLVAVVDTGEANQNFITDAIAFASFRRAQLSFVIMSPDISSDIAGLFDPGRLTSQENRATQVSDRIASSARGGDVEVRTLGGDTEALLDGLSTHVGGFDLAIFGPPECYGNQRIRRRAAETAALASGRPILCLPSNREPRSWKHLVVGWNGSREATRALNDALAWAEPGADFTVAVVDADPLAYDVGVHPGAAIARHLVRHGFKADVQELWSQGEKVSDVLVDLTAKSGADLLVIGVVAHSRVHKLILGGVTSDLLHGTSVPVLLSH